MLDDEATKREGHGERAQRSEDKLARGTLVGRYVVIDQVGAGGMGVVYAAYDPELDRKVAIKLMQARAGGSSGGEQAWILREAQAMARLSHPNVVAVHDVGTLPGERVFIAMELVEGLTLRRWLQGERRWEEVLEVMRAAGRGLVAAHAAGLVHRDFKPENVLIGSDGRVRVMDFGLARLQGDEPTPRASDLDIEVHSPLSSNLTIAGSVVGTPAYMAPELEGGSGADARSDQFSFGVALYEALYGTRPPDPPPERSAVPLKIQRTVLRAISKDPVERFASIDALLAELAFDAGVRRRRLLVAGGATLAAAAAAASALLATRSHTPLCHGIERRMVGVWDPDIDRRVHDAFLATKLPDATHAYAAVSRALDAYGKDWVAATAESCEATRVRGDQTEEVMTVRADCLDRRLGELRSFAQLLATADDGLVSRAASAAEQLEPISSCSNVALLRAPGPPPPAVRERLAGVFAKLADAKAAMIAGKIGAAINATTAAANAAHAIPYEPVEAESRVALGITLLQAGNAPDAMDAFAAGTWAGLRSHRDDVAAEGAFYAATAAATSLLRDDEAKVWLGVGTAVMGRWGATADRRLELRGLETTGIVLGHSGDLAGAIKAHEQALVLSKQIFGDDGWLVSNTEQLLATTLTKIGAHAKAVPHFEHAISIIETLEPPDHPDLAPLLMGVGICYAHVGQLDKAQNALGRSLGIREKTFGADNPMLAPVLNNMADMLVRNGAAVEALPLIERAVNLGMKLGTAHPVYHTLETTHGEVLAALGRLAEARVLLDAVLSYEDTTHSAVLVTTLTSRASIELVARQWADAAAFAQRAITAAETTGGKESVELWQPLATLARANRELGHASDVRPLLERAIGIAEKAQADSTEIAKLRSELVPP